ncbi:MAG: MurT ligase domain-containing protein [Thermoanaerobacteraceae bacterium]
MNFIGVNIGKLTNLACKVTGRGGTSLPGKIALKYDKTLIYDLLKNIKEKIIITGTNGKTTTSGLISSILIKSGKSIVNNREGANMASGIATALLKNSNIFGELRKDMAVFEIDEANMPLILEDINPKIVLITNFFRDQLDRYGELDNIIQKVKDSIQKLPKDSIVLLNADDPFTASLANESKVKIFYYGINDDFKNTYISQTFEQKYCPVCGSKYVYKKVYYGQLGDYYCPKCGNKRPDLNFYAYNLNFSEDGISFNLKYNDKILPIKSNLSGSYNVYNIMASAAVSLLLNINIQDIQEGIKNYNPIAGRLQKTYLKNKKTLINLVKNPIAFESTLIMINEINKFLNLVVAINDNFADGRDISWIWDVNFEDFISNTKINKIITTGLRAEDVALRFKYAGVKTDNIFIINPIEKALLKAADITNDELIVVLPNYTALHDINKFFKMRRQNI